MCPMMKPSVSDGFLNVPRRKRVSSMNKNTTLFIIGTVIVVLVLVLVFGGQQDDARTDDYSLCWNGL